MSKEISDFASEEPEIQELARGIYKLYLTVEDESSEPFYSNTTSPLLRPFYAYQLNSIRLIAFLKAGAMLRNSFKEEKLKVGELGYSDLLKHAHSVNFEKLNDILTPDKNVAFNAIFMKILLVTLHVWKIVSLDYKQEFMSLHRLQDNTVIGKRFFRSNNEHAARLYTKKSVNIPGYSSLEDQFSAILNACGFRVWFDDGFCLVDLSHTSKLAAVNLIYEYKDSTIIPCLTEMLPRILPDVMAEYIDLTMAFPKKENVYEHKMKGNNYVDSLKIDYSSVNENTPLYHPLVLECLKKVGLTKNTKKELLPQGRTGQKLISIGYKIQLYPYNIYEDAY